MQLAWIDYLLIVIYFSFVLGIGVLLKRQARTSTDFFLSGRAIPAWIAGLAFISANLGAQEVIGMAASGAKYGIATSHFYWVGAIPAMIFVGIFMMPFYYGSRARSVPEYLKLRFDEKTRGLNAISFAAMTVFSSGVSMYAMGKLLQLLLGWDFTVSVLLSAGIVLVYTYMGGLTSAIYNEVLQFFLIVAGFLPLVIVGLIDVGGWDGLTARLASESVARGLDPGAMTHSWQYMGSPSANPMGVEWFGLVMGLGFVLSFGYWCTDFLVVQRAMAADSMNAARRTPLIAAVPKMLFPALVILPGMIAIAVAPRSDIGYAGAGAAAEDPVAVVAQAGGPAVPLAAVRPQGLIPPKIDEATGEPVVGTDGRIALDYDLAIPMMLKHYFPAGMLGLGLCALMASFMSGMAGNVTAFNTVWTYDIYQAHVRKTASDGHYLWMGRAATVGGIALSMAAAYAVSAFNNIMDFLQLVFAFVNAPLFATFALGMFWRRSTGHGAFWGLLAGTAGAALHHGLSLARGAAPGIKGGYFVPLLRYPTELAQTFWTAIVAFAACLLVSVVVSLATRARSDHELRGLVYSLTPRPAEGGLAWWQRPATLAVALLVATVALNLAFL
jgi:solute:Na+ symporter, SSS family